jgi:hypothetical protein
LRKICAGAFGPSRITGVWFSNQMLSIVGRGREQAELAAALDGARAGHGRVVLVLGEAGLGKSMLADWLVTEAEQAGMLVARGACSAAGMPPLWPWRRALAAISPELPWRDDHATTGPSGRELLAAAVVDAAAAAATDRPLLIVLEDLHWSDPVSVLVARAVAQAAAALPLMLLLTCRDERDEATAQVRDLLAELPASVRRMLLPPLDAGAVAVLARRIAGPGLTDQEAAGLHGRTGGNPFFTHEVARLIAARGPAAALMVPPGVREVLQRRLARLSQPCASLLTAAAIIAETAPSGGQPAIEDDLLGQVSGVSGQAAARLLDEGAAGRLLDVDPAGATRWSARSSITGCPRDGEVSCTRPPAGPWSCGWDRRSRRPDSPTTGPARPAPTPGTRPSPGHCGRRGTPSPGSASRPRRRTMPGRWPASQRSRSPWPSSTARRCRCAVTSPPPGRCC